MNSSLIDKILPLRIGTRASPLALTQTRLVAEALRAAHPEMAAEGSFEIHEIRTSGDQWQEGRLNERGGKGLFTKEIEEALAEGHIDLAVHSLKDMPTRLPVGLMLSAFLPRGDVRDAFISHRYNSLNDLPAGATVGTASLRRQAQILRKRPDLHVAILRGNVETRLRKIADGIADATLLAAAGLLRLNLLDRAKAILPADDFIPAIAQGAIAIETRENDDAIRALLAPIHCARTATAVTAERAFLAELDGSCKTPIAGHAHALDENHQGHWQLKVLVLRPNGQDAVEETLIADEITLENAAADLGRRIRARLPSDFFIE